MILHCKKLKKNPQNKKPNNRVPCLLKVLKEQMLNEWSSDTWPLISRINICKPSWTFKTKPEQKINYVLGFLLLNLLVEMTQLLDMQCIVNDVLQKLFRCTVVSSIMRPIDVAPVVQSACHHIYLNRNLTLVFYLNNYTSY